MEEFKLYLESQGLKANTVADYMGRILRVAKAEKLTLSALAENIAKITVDYSKNGQKSKDGKRSHFSVINALKHFLKFTNNEVKKV